MTDFTLATLRTPDGPQAALGVGQDHYLLGEAEPVLKTATVRTLLDDWPTSLTLLEHLVDDIVAGSSAATAIGSAVADLATPVMYPAKLLAVGANYVDHLEEMGLQASRWASMPFFLRPPTTSLVGPGTTVRIPRSTKEFDWECELAVVVGSRLSHATRQEAAAAIAAYTIGLDLSCRDLIPAGNDLKVDLARGKAQDTMAPCGPYLTPARFVPDAGDLRIQLWVDDQQMMDASTSQMLYRPDEQLSAISEYITLEPGDILFTGSPGGSAGEHGNRWLGPGDRIHAEIEGLGALDVRMQDEA